MKQRLSVVTLGVSDLERSRAFYEALGWGRRTRALNLGSRRQRSPKTRTGGSPEDGGTQLN